MNANNERNGEGNEREPSLYPYASFPTSLKIADAIKDLGGARVAVSKSRLSAHFSQSEKSAAFQQKISSAKAFGLIVGRSDYLLTDTAKRYYSPLADGQKPLALIQCFSTPSSFKEIINRFDGDTLPNREILANIFEELKVPESWKLRAAAFFENGAQFIGVIDKDRILRIQAAQHAHTIATQPPLVEPVNTPKPSTAGSSETNPAVEECSDQEKHSLFLDKEKTKKFTICSPLSLSRAEYSRICKWIEVTLIIEDSEPKQT
jgi:hypothetical protein